MYKIYILKSINHSKTYVGYTNNLKRRLIEHNSGRSSYTKIYKPWKLIYEENYKNVVEARNKEKYFKSCAGRKKIKKILESDN